jgi:quercetin dioxygenase-like cupin family protein
VTGGNFTGAKTIAPGETRAQKINGGEEHKLTKGDIIVIPKGVPHWFKEIDGTFDYLVVKVST